MFTSSSLPRLLHLHSSSRPLLFRPESSYSSYPPSPRPRTKRPNRLCPKLPRTLIPTPLPPLPPSPPPPDEPSAACHQLLPLRDEHLLPLREGEEAVGDEETAAAAAAAVGVELPAAVAAAERFSPKSVLGLALQFTVLIAVETAVAVWLFGGASSEEKVTGVEQVPNAEAPKFGSEVGDFVEFDKKVLEIRAMAKEAREEERRELAEDSGKGELSRRMDELKKKANLITLGSSDYSSFVISPSKKNRAVGKIAEKKSNLAKKVRFSSNHAKSKDAPRGFNRSKSNDKRDNVANGSIEQIAEKDNVGQPSVMQPSSQLNAEESRVAKASGVEEMTSPQRKKSSKTLRSSLDNEVNNPVGAPQLDGQPVLEPQPINSRTKATIISKQVKHQAVSDKDKTLLKTMQIDSKEKPWWLKLPYVLGIFLHRDFKRDGPKGLYSLDINSSSDDEDVSSYTIAFQDRGDATNFCFLLESFFQDLGDVSADVVPLTIEELVEAEKSHGFNVLVVRKGQLHLYAGQPLAEAEASLRSLLDYTIDAKMM